MSINRRNLNDNENENDDDDDDNNYKHHDELDEEVEETEEDLIENYRFLTKHCGVLKQSTTSGVLNQIQQSKQQTNFLRQYSSISESTNRKTHDYQHSIPSTKQRCSPINDLNNSHFTTIETPTSTTSRVPPTIYYDDTEDDLQGHNRSFSLVRLFTRMKTRLKHDKRYRPKQSHELLCEADPTEWYELTKNVRTILTKALLPDGGYDAVIQRSKSTRHHSHRHHHHHRQSSFRKSRDIDPVLDKDIDNEDEDKIDFDIDDELNTEGDADFDEIVWNKFLSCPRGYYYRRCGVCKAVDRQQFQGQLVYFYGVANNILIDENLKASGLG